MEKIKFLKVLFLQQKYIVPQQILENARKGFTIKTVYDIIKKSKYTDKRGFAHGSVMETAPDCVD